MQSLVCLFVLFSCTLSVLCDSSNCSYTDTDGNYYDLSPLTYDPSSPSPSTYQISDTYNTYYINFCEEVSQLIGNGTCSDDNSAATCQYSGGSYYSCGSSDNYEWTSYQSKLYLTFLL